MYDASVGDHKLLLARLLWIERSPKNRAPKGLCHALLPEGEPIKKLARGLIRSWPERGPRVHHPVPDPLGECDASAFYCALSTDGMWVGEYGESRRRLLGHMIDKLRGVP